MADRIIVKAVKVDAHGHELSKEVIISDKEITCPTSLTNFGYNRAEQLEIMGNIQQSLLDKQAIFLKSAS